MLEVGEAGHDCILVIPGKGEENLTQFAEDGELPEYIFPDAHPQARGNLIVPRSAGMQPSADFFSGVFDEVRFDPGMDVLELITEHRVGDTVIIELEKCREQRLRTLRFDDPLFVQHHDMCNIDKNVRIGQVPVSSHGGEKVHHFAGSFSCETAPPHHIIAHRYNNL
jgi:hypothetical protein